LIRKPPVTGHIRKPARDRPAEIAGFPMSLDTPAFDIWFGSTGDFSAVLNVVSDRGVRVRPGVSRFREISCP